jgi:hypothetical protein
MNYYVHRTDEALEHALRVTGAERPNHKYVSRINVGGRFRYFYTPEELAAFRAGKKIGRKKAESQPGNTTRKPKSGAGIKVIRKDGSKQRVKPISSKTSSSETGRQILERLLKRRRKKKRKNQITVKPINSTNSKSDSQLQVIRKDRTSTIVKPKTKSKPTLKVTTENNKSYKVRPVNSKRRRRTYRSGLTVMRRT